MNPLDAAPVLPGETLAGKYRVERVLGKGGMGIVVAARHLELEQRVAIKFLLGERAAPAVERFLREARAAAQVKSEHVCRVHDVSRLESGEPYIVMEYLEGRDLGQKLARDGAVSVEHASNWVIEACAALAEAHAAGIVHRDLKPANLFLTERTDGTTCVKVLDFGISKLPNLSDMTSTAVMVGSPLYMSPEQIESSRTVDARADIWSLGVILYELVSGLPPFSAGSMIQLSIKVREEDSPPLSGHVQGVGADFEAVVRKCLAKAPAERFASAAELAAALAPFANADSAHLAGRLMRTRSTVDPAMRPTMRGSPTNDVLANAGAPSPVPASREATPHPALPEKEAGTPPPGQVTFAPLNTTAERIAPRAAAIGRKWLVAGALGLAGTLAIGLALRGRALDPAHDAASTAAPSEISPTPEAAPAPSNAIVFDSTPTAPVAPNPSSLTVAPVDPKAKRVAPITLAPTPMGERKDAAAASATPATPANDAPAAGSASSPPEKATPDPTGRKKRALDRSDPF